MPSFAHIVNPVRVAPGSDLFTAQPLTFESMRRGLDCAGSAGIPVHLFTAQYPEDHAVLPAGFTTTPDLERSASDVARFKKPRKLPLFGDILGRLYRASDADIFVYTNVDIVLRADFYIEAARRIGEGLDSFTVTRRTVEVAPGAPCSVEWLTTQSGVPHPGFDCFVFRRSLMDGVDFRELLIGTTGIGKAVVGVLSTLDPTFRILTELHLTFHANADEPWRDPAVADYRAHNARQAVLILEAIRSRTGRLSPLAEEYLSHYRNFPAPPPPPGPLARLKERLRIRR